MSYRIDHLAPLTDRLLRLAVRGLDLPARPRVLDLCCGLGSACRLLAGELEAVCTGVDRDEALLRTARERALESGLQERIELRHGDARHIELPNGEFDLVLALGGALTYIGRPEGLERIRQLLKPQGALLLSDLVYLDSTVPEEVRRILEKEAPGSKIRSLSLEPAVRAVFEEGVYRFETEESYHVLLETLGYRVLYAFPVPESAWNAYYRSAMIGRDVPSTQPRIPVEPDELAAYYCWGGRWGLAYLVCGARVGGSDPDREGQTSVL